MNLVDPTIEFLTEEEYRAAIPEIESLFRASFGRGLGNGYLSWRYLDNPATDLLACVARDTEGRIVANYSASPCIMTTGEGTVRTALSMTTMTHPDYQGRGMFTILAEALYGHMVDSGYSMVWGFPNPISHRPFVERLKWLDIYEIPTMILEVNKVNEKNVLRDSGVLRDDEFDLAYGQNLGLDGMIHLCKNETYLRWRYADNPIHNYCCFALDTNGRARSYAVVKAYGDDGVDLVDFQACDAKDGAALMSSVVRYARDEGRQRVFTWAPRHHFMHGLCERFGFANDLPVTYFGTRALSEVSTNELDVCNYSRWFVQMGDSDVY